LAFGRPVREPRAQVVLLVRAFEEVDGDGIVLPGHLRAAATRRALMVTGLSDWKGELGDARNFRNGETVARRARLLFEALRRKVPVLGGVLRIARLGAGTAPALIGIALLVGLGSNALGPARHINLLSFPVLGLLAWNAVVYLALLGNAVIRWGAGDRVVDEDADEAGPRSLAGFLSGVFLKGALWRRLHGRRFAMAGTEGERRITARALVRFGALWHRHARDLLAARVRRTLHLGAMAMTVGTVAGMYVRGIAFAYRVVWESTWLDAGQVQGLLGLVLGPAAMLLGVEIPDVALLQGPGGEGDAAPWIHLYAMTALLFVGFPRAVLALLEGYRCSRLARNVQVDLHDGYFRKQFSAWRGATREVEVLPYSYSPRAVALDRLKALLQDAFGARARIRVRESLDYGAEVRDIASCSRRADDSTDDTTRDAYCVVLFNLAQSPEMEVHGALLDDLKDRLEDGRCRLLVLLDVSGYHDRVRDPARRQERLRAWLRVVNETGLSAVDVELGRPLHEAELVELLINSMREATWPSSDAVAAG
jgi:hypothetical protein